MHTSWLKKQRGDKQKKLKKWLSEAQYTVVFTGAGMSTEAGLPDFRSESSGIWHHMNPIELASTDAMEYNREAFTAFYQYRVESLQKCNPHAGHAILAEWERTGMLKSIITQNVDGFHHLAGSKNVQELHGTLRTCHCNQCQERYPIEQFMEKKFICNCGGFIRPSVVLFGESLPLEVLKQAEMEAKKADLFIVLGSSLTVSPANLFPSEAKAHGAKLVIVNLEQTSLDHEADLVINNEKVGEFLTELVQGSEN